MKKRKNKISRQRKWMINKTKQGLCMICGKPNVIKMYCEKHRQMHNDINKKYKKLIKSTPN